MNEGNGAPKLIERRGNGWYRVAGMESPVRGAENALRAAHAHALNELTETLHRVQFAQRHGMQYDDDRDLYQVGGYPRSLTYQNFADLYDRDPIASRIVDMPPATTWRNPPEITEPEQDEGTEFTETWKELVKRLKVWRMMERTDRLSRIGRFSVLLIGTPVSRAEELRQPLTRISGPEQVLFLSAFSEKYAKVKQWVRDTGDARYGLPELYQITLSREAEGFQATTAMVHHSRVIHVAEDLLEDDTYGREVLRPIYNDLHDYQKIATSTAEAYWQRVAGILQAKISGGTEGKPITVDDKDVSEVLTQLEEMHHNLRRVFAGQNVELSRLAESEPDPSKSSELYQTRIAAGAGIPKRMIFGSETGERASEQDQQAYLGGIRERQQQHAEPSLLRELIDRLVAVGGLPRHGREGYDVVWPDLSEEPEKDVAEANRLRAEAAKALAGMGGVPMDFVEVDEKRNVWLRPTGDRGEMTADELEPPEPEPVAPPGVEGEPEDEPEGEEA